MRALKFTYEMFIRFLNLKFPNCLKKDFRNGLRKVGEPIKVFPLIDREDVICETLEKMEERWEEGEYNPIIGFHAAPGGGKSSLVDEFLILDLKNRTSKRSLHDALSNVLTVQPNSWKSMEKCC